MESRAISEIKSDAQRLVTVKIGSAIESGDWAMVWKLAEELKLISHRGMYHDSKSKVKSIGAFAMNGHSEREVR